LASEEKPPLYALVANKIGENVLGSATVTHSMCQGSGSGSVESVTFLGLQDPEFFERASLHSKPVDCRAVALFKASQRTGGGGGLKR
jgi:hypothetical protein